MYRYLTSAYPFLASRCNPVARPYQRYLENVVWEVLQDPLDNNLSAAIRMMSRIEAETRRGRVFIYETPSSQGGRQLKSVLAKLVVVNIELSRGTDKTSVMKTPEEPSGAFGINITDRAIVCSISFSVQLL